MSSSRSLSGLSERLGIDAWPGSSMRQIVLISGAPVTTIRDGIEKVGVGDVQRVVKKYLAPELATIVVIPPQTAAVEPVAKSSLWVTPGSRK